jgi:hypothetical protein
MTDEPPTHDLLTSEIAASEARKRAHQHRGTPSHNAIEQRISDEATADALARKRERDANQTNR